MMSADNRNMDLGLGLGYSNNRTGIRMNENPGAGVNAGSSVNLKFPASDSISELVWSPHKGLSLKCAQGSLPDKRSFLLWNVGPSSFDEDPSPSKSIKCEGNNDDKIVAGNLVISKAELHLENKVAQRASLTESPKSTPTPISGSIPGLIMESEDEMVEGKIEVGVLAISRAQTLHHLGRDENEVCDLAEQQKDYMPESSKNNAGLLIPNLLSQGPRDSSCDMAEAETSSLNLNKEIPIDLNHTSDNVVISRPTLEEGSKASVGDTRIQSGDHISPLQILPTKEAKGANEEERKNKLNVHGHDHMVPGGGKLEYTGENDLLPLTKQDAYQQSEERLVRGCSVPLDTVAENHSGDFHHQLKGKDKALSEGNVSRSLLDNEDDSQDTVESCNSACLLGKRRWNFGEQLMLENKRMRKDINGNIASASVIRHDSSFMNWISNMVNGFSKFNHEDGPSLDFSLAHSSHEDTSFIQDNVICSRVLQEPISRNTGFQTIFQSLYCPGPNLLEAGTLENDCSAQVPHLLMQIDNNDVHISPTSFSGQNGASSNTDNIVGQSDQALFLSDHKITITDDGNPHNAYDGRATCELSKKGNVFGSLWITRFTTKVCSTSLNLDNPNKNDCTTLNPQTQISLDFPMVEKCPDTEHKSDENLAGLGKELQTFVANTESSHGSKKMHEHNYEDPVHKLSSAESSSKLRTSEAMASTFARRLDALKHIIPTVAETNASSRVPTCSFCGKSGHNFRTCSEVTETELVEVFSNKQKSCFIDKDNNLEDASRNSENPYVNASHEKPMSNRKEFSRNQSLSSDETLNQINSNPSLPLINFVSMDVAEVPKGVFDTVRRLQLSRADMLKWINSNVSLSHLEGLFLRLRLGKWEAGLGGNGYYVARITVDQSGESLNDCKKSISVNVGGMKCLVGSQYISNHDFLEDELMVWWCRILKTGGKVPSREDLDSKLRRRITLGF